jgi:hypothetical protein
MLTCEVTLKLTLHGLAKNPRHDTAFTRERPGRSRGIPAALFRALAIRHRRPSPTCTASHGHRCSTASVERSCLKFMDLVVSRREELGYDCRRLSFEYWRRGVRCDNRGHQRAFCLGANAVSTIRASPIASFVTVAIQTQAGGLGKAQRSRALLLTAHAHLVVRAKRNARKLFKRLPGRSKTASRWDAKGLHRRAFAGRQTG